MEEKKFSNATMEHEQEEEKINSRETKKSFLKRIIEFIKQEISISLKIDEDDFDDIDDDEIEAMEESFEKEEKKVKLIANIVTILLIFCLVIVVYCPKYIFEKINSNNETETIKALEGYPQTVQFEEVDTKKIAKGDTKYTMLLIYEAEQEYMATWNNNTYIHIYAEIKNTESMIKYTSEILKNIPEESPEREKIERMISDYQYELGILKEMLKWHEEETEVSKDFY